MVDIEVNGEYREPLITEEVEASAIKIWTSLLDDYGLNCDRFPYSVGQNVVETTEGLIIDPRACYLAERMWIALKYKDEYGQNCRLFERDTQAALLIMFRNSELFYVYWCKLNSERMFSEITSFYLMRQQMLYLGVLPPSGLLQVKKDYETFCILLDASRQRYLEKYCKEPVPIVQEATQEVIA